MQKILSISIIIVGIIHLLPITGVLGAERLFSLYGIPIDDPNIEILIRHRAVLFGILGAFFVYAAFKPSLQFAAIVVGLISTFSFIFLAWGVGDYNSAISRVVIADIVASGFLIIAALLFFYINENR